MTVKEQDSLPLATGPREPSKEREKFIKVGEVFQATLEHHHYGFWTTREEAEEYIKQYAPDATPFEGMPDDIDKLPKGKYYIMPRTLYSFQPEKEGLLQKKP